MAKNDRFTQFGNALAHFATQRPALITKSTLVSCNASVKVYFIAPRDPARPKPTEGVTYDVDNDSHSVVELHCV